MSALLWTLEESRRRMKRRVNWLLLLLLLLDVSLMVALAVLLSGVKMHPQ